MPNRFDAYLKKIERQKRAELSACEGNRVKEVKVHRKFSRRILQARELAENVDDLREHIERGEIENYPNPDDELPIYWNDPVFTKLREVEELAEKRSIEGKLEDLDHGRLMRRLGSAMTGIIERKMKEKEYEHFYGLSVEEIYQIYLRINL